MVVYACVRVEREVIKESKDRRGVVCLGSGSYRQERRPSHNIRFRQSALALPKHDPQYILRLQKIISSVEKRKTREKSRGNVCRKTSETGSTGIQSSPHLSRGDPRRSQVALVQHLQPPIPHIRPQRLDPRPIRFWTLPLIPRTRRRFKRRSGGPGSPDRSP